MFGENTSTAAESSLDMAMYSIKQTAAVAIESYCAIVHLSTGQQARLSTSIESTSSRLRQTYLDKLMEIQMLLI